MVSVVVLSKNEEQDIARCLDSLTWCDDIHILDSGSTDSTLEIAKRYTVNISVNQFESFGQQRNHALEHLNLRHPWILFFDADEVCTVSFREKLLKAISAANDDVAGFYCCWKMMLENKWLKFSDNFPKWQFRVLKKGKARFKDFGHGQKEEVISGSIQYIREPYLHYGFSKGWAHWIERHNRYSSQEAIARLKNRPPFKHVFVKHASIRNTALKSWLSRMPGWPAFRFLHTYFINLGFLEGKPGFTYCLNMAYYEFLIQIKMREMKQKECDPVKGPNRT